MKPCLANFRFYEELNDFVSGDHYKQTIAYRFGGQPTIKDPIEALGVPHTEVDLILVNDYRVRSLILSDGSQIQRPGPIVLLF